MKPNQMKLNHWTIGLAAAGVVSLGSVAQAEEHPVISTLASTTLSGYVDTSAILQFGGKAAGNPAPTVYGRSFDGASKLNNINLNVVKLQLEHAPDDVAQWSAGYNASVLFGPDANTLASNSQRVNNSDFAIKNAYVVLHAPLGGNGLDVKVGVWDTIIGYEVFEAGKNMNYSRSFGFSIEPVVHTGVLGTYKPADWLALNAGIANRGDNNVINGNSGVDSLRTYLGSITLTAPESMGSFKGASLTLGIVDSGTTSSSKAPAVTRTTGESDIVNYYAGLSLPLGEKFTIGGAWDYRVNGLQEGSWENAIGAYLQYKVTEKFTLSDRLEYATGTEVAGAAAAYGVTLPNNTAELKLLANTLTVDYSLWANTITRAELRWDHDLTGTGIFNDGTDMNAFSVALNVIYNF